MYTDLSIHLEKVQNSENSTKASLLIHIGYHKTGSSFLQKAIFKEGIGFYSPWHPNEYIEQLIITNPFSFDETQVRQYFNTGIEESYQRQLLPVVSHEMLSGFPWSNGEYNSIETANRLYRAFPEGHVLIIIREQLSMIESFYKHLVKGFFTASIKDYLELPDYGFRPFFRREYLEYHWLISYYQNLFGKERILVLPYEMLNQEGEKFLGEISRFSGVDIPAACAKTVVNQGYLGLTVAIKRHVNKLAPRVVHPNKTTFQKINNSFFYQLNRLLPDQLSAPFDRSLAEYIRNNIGEHYAVSNQKTAELTGLDLKGYGYIL